MIRLQVDSSHYISVRALDISEDGSQVLFSQKEIIQRLQDIETQNGDDSSISSKLKEKLWKLTTEEEPILSEDQMKWISLLGAS